MATDQLGRIANQHKILADQMPDGVLNPDCITLAELHSTAVGESTHPRRNFFQLLVQHYDMLIRPRRFF